MAIEVKVIGLDIAKNVFQIHGVNHRGETVLRRRLRRAQVSEFFRQRTPCLIGIEATQGAHHWGRVLRAFGHKVRLIAPQFVKPYLKSQKNDANDAEAICEAVSRPVYSVSLKYLFGNIQSNRFYRHREPPPGLSLQSSRMGPFH